MLHQHLQCDSIAPASPSQHHLQGTAVQSLGVVDVVWGEERKKNNTTSSSFPLPEQMRAVLLRRDFHRADVQNANPSAAATEFNELQSHSHSCSLSFLTRTFYASQPGCGGAVMLSH